MEEKKWRKMAGGKRKGGRKRHILDKTLHRLWEVIPDGSGCGLGGRVCSVSANIVQRATELARCFSQSEGHSGREWSVLIG